MHHRLPRSSRSLPVGGRRPLAAHGRGYRIGLVLAVCIALGVTAGAVLGFLSPPTNGSRTAALALTAAHEAQRSTEAAHHRHDGHRPSARATQKATRHHPASTEPAEARRTRAAAEDHRGDHRGDHRREHHASAADATPNPACTLVVPATPTSAAGLTTPYQLLATDDNAGSCHEANADQAAFVEAAVLDQDTGRIGIYHPLVVDAGSQPALAPSPVQLPTHSVVGVWFGFNGDTLTLRGPGASSCVNGLGNSLFGQFAYCNAPAFFTAAHTAISAGLLSVPALGTASDGMPCPTTRDFAVVDQDQSDNLATAYRIVDGRMAQDVAAAGAGTKLTNGSDEGLLAKLIDPALGCTPFTAPDLTTGGATQTPALALNELSAAAHQTAPVALVPTSDPMTQVDGEANVAKTNLYRLGVDQPPLAAGETAEAYCTDYVTTAPARFATASGQFRGASSPTPGTDLYDFLNERYLATLQILGCAGGE
jgi:hypothetical protein